MNKLTILILLVFVVSLVGCAQQQTVQQPPPVQQAQPPAQQQGQVAVDVQPAVQEIKISGFAFNPAELTIAVGTSVKWVNEDSAPHAITSENFKSSTLSKGDSYSFRFATPGIYDYACSIHSSMKGQIIVK